MFEFRNGSLHAESVALETIAREVFARVGERRLKLLFEPGRNLVGNAGVLLTRIEYLKHGAARNFALVYASMNDLIRPALYDAWHHILPVRNYGGPQAVYDVVGSVCESAAILGKERKPGRARPRSW